jgi:hypothetical protein
MPRKARPQHTHRCHRRVPPQRVPFEAIKSIGRWSSDSFSKHLRKHAQILAPYVQAHPDLHQRVSHEQMAVIRWPTQGQARRLEQGSLPARHVGERLQHRAPPQLAGSLPVSRPGQKALGALPTL